MSKTCLKIQGKDLNEIDLHEECKYCQKKYSKSYLLRHITTCKEKKEKEKETIVNNELESLKNSIKEKKKTIKNMKKDMKENEEKTSKIILQKDIEIENLKKEKNEIIREKDIEIKKGATILAINSSWLASLYNM
jgi:hypothetical protein